MPEGGKVDAKNKVILAVIWALGLGCCGVDRCYMGNICLGVVKGLTAGGLGVWATIDYFVILINLRQKDLSIDMLGIKGQFEKGGVGTAFIIACVFLALHVLKCAYQTHRQLNKQPSDGAAMAE